MPKDIFDVRFMKRPLSDIPEDIKNEYLDMIKNQWGYSSVTKFLNTIIEWMKEGQLVLFSMNPESLSKLKAKIKADNYSDMEDWFKTKIREELNE